MGISTVDGVKQAQGKVCGGRHWPQLLFFPSRYSQAFGTQVAFIPIGDIVRTTNRHVRDGARDGHHWVLLVNAAVHLWETQENVLPSS